MRSRRSTRSSAVLALVASLVLAAAASASPVPPLGHSGRWITDRKGRVVILHGVNMVNKLPPYRPDAIGFGPEDADFIRSQGFDAVRLGIVYKALEPQRGVYDDAYLGRILATARMLERRGIFVLVDFHQDMYNERFDGEGFPDWAVDDDGLPAAPDQGFPANYFVMPALWRAYDHFWADDGGLQESYAAAWRHVAERFRAERSLVGFDIFNEPFAGSQWESCASPAGCAFEAGPLTALSKKVFGAIRQVEPAKLLWWEPHVGFTFGADTQHGDTGDSRAGMSFHDYCVAAPGGADNAGGPDHPCGELEQQTMDNALAQGEAKGDALLLTEFGATDDLNALKRVLDKAEAAMVPWLYWSYWNEDVCCKRPTEGVVNDLTKPPAGDNLKQDKLGVLVRPYPQAVAGTPQRWSFDRDSHVFELAYATRPPGAGKRATYTPTEVWLPRRQYPKGYTLAVTGARVVSKPNAQRLLLRAKLAAGRVTLKVTPRG